MSKVTGFTQGHTSSGLMTWYAGILDCGHWYYSETLKWAPIEGIEINLNDDVACTTCADLARDEAELEAMDLSTVAYFRFDTRWDVAFVTVMLLFVMCLIVLLDSDVSNRIKALELRCDGRCQYGDKACKDHCDKMGHCPMESK